MLQQIIKDIFGFDSLRPQQEEAINAIMNKQDCLVIMPTGGGKSLCYQAPAIASNGLAIVISPLIALMKDQVDSLKENGIVAAYWNSTLSSSGVSDLISELRSGLIKILYVAPERFSSASFLAVIKELSLTLIAIDEAHCVSEWGHDFRPDYRNLHLLKDLFPGVPRIALTATATEKVAEDISKTLQLNNPVLINSSFDRHNLYYEVRQKTDAYGQIVKYLRTQAGKAGIIYCSSRKKVEEISRKLCGDGFSVLPYHAGLADKERSENHEQFIHDKVQIIVATIAFGMGIDKSNIRFIIHHDLPKSIESYYQETGRAGRDGAPSECLLFFSFADKFTIESFIDQMPDEVERKRSYQKLTKMIDFSFKQLCRRRMLLAYFGEKYPHPFCGRCDVCCSLHDAVNATEISYKILSAIVRLKQDQGAQLVIDVLRGIPSDKISSILADQLSVFGICSDQTEEQLRTIIDALTREEYIQIDQRQIPILQLTEQAFQAIRGRKTILLYIPPVKTEKKEKPIQKAIDDNEQLYLALYKVRKELAISRNVPPYVIFTDKTLQEMAALQPQTEAELLQIAGISKYKAEMFGTPFLDKCRSSKNILLR